jgi:hypothetical protein
VRRLRVLVGVAGSVCGKVLTSACEGVCFRMHVEGARESA